MKKFILIDPTPAYFVPEASSLALPKGAYAGQAVMFNLP
jgi:hypothetical protein